MRALVKGSDHISREKSKKRNLWLIRVPPEHIMSSEGMHPWPKDFSWGPNSRLSYYLLTLQSENQVPNTWTLGR
jgi:hypothetical protein